MKYIYVIIILLLSACSNFVPIYSQDQKFATFLSSIEIEEVETLESTELYHHITKLFGSSHDTKYILKLSLSDTIAPLIITREANVAKQNVTQLCNYSLIDKSSGVVLLEGKIRLIGSYSSTAEPYASYTHEKHTKKSITQTVAEELRMRLMLYFSNHQTLADI
jgi:hypothetical protein